MSASHDRPVLSQHSLLVLTPLLLSHEDLLMFLPYAKKE